MFTPRFSAAGKRLTGGDTDLWAVHADAQTRLAAGEDIIIMSVGDPDLPTIDPIIEHAVTNLYRGRTHYSPGRGELHLRQTIADIESQASGKPTDPDQVLIFPGATNAIYSALSCLLDAGDELIVCDPHYVGYDGIFAAIGCRVVHVPGDPDNGFNVVAERVIAACSPQTRVLLLNTPGNPAGNIVPAETLFQLAQYCLSQGIWLVCDEVYSMITFETPHISIRRAAKDLTNVIVVDGLSKSHAMTGWRLGWTVSEPSVADVLLEFTSATVFGCSQFIQDAAAFAMKNDSDYIRTITAEYRTRRDYVCDRLQSIPRLTAARPEAGMFLMIDVSNTGSDGLSFARQLLDETGVSVLPGAGFGAVCRDFVRLSLTHPVPVLEQALDRIEAYTTSS